MSVDQLIATITQNIFNPLITLLFAVATLVFAWGVVLYIIGSYNSQSKIEQAKNIMLWGLIGMFIMASAWGIVALLCNFFGSQAVGC